VSDRTPFHDLDRYVALPRAAGLVLSPDGDRLITGVSTLDAERTGYVTALWEIDPEGIREARRLTRGVKGESQPAFLPGGDLLFVSARPDPDTKDDKDDPRAALWQLPRDGGEARVVATRPGGVTGVRVAREEGTAVITSPTLPGAAGTHDDEERRKRRKDRKVSAILHDSYPVRFWDHDLGPDQPRLYAGQVPAAPPAGVDAHELGRLALRQLTPDPGRSLDEAVVDVSPDGRRLVTTWHVRERGGRRTALALIDLEAAGEVDRDGEPRGFRLLIDDAGVDQLGAVFSADGLRLAVLTEVRSTATQPPDVRLAVLDLALDELTPVAADWDRWPSLPTWTPDGAALLVTADDGGRAPVFRIDLSTGEITRLTGDHGCYTDLQVSPDGEAVFALRGAYDGVPSPVRLDARAAEQEPTMLPGPAEAPPLPGSLTEVTATAEDGVPLRGWLCLPDDATAHHPVPLLLWIHGGPLHSWNSWSWRWNPWLLVARGYAVLLPDPALSTGYGYEFVRRGWGSWGAAPYTDLMAITDAVCERADIDADRTGAMGGSFGGYMANWVAGHTDRFRGIVSHAGLWALDQFGPTTDGYDYWRREMTPGMAFDNSPHRFVDSIRTPMLVIHGDRDYRVPIGEALRLWAELAERAQDDDGGMPHKFLYFPDENHWVLGPEHAKVWYETVIAFLATTVLDEAWRVPDVLR
jgi:dipeptidyl aminopeptidase/acylaminoacyl peptidase